MRRILLLAAISCSLAACQKMKPGDGSVSLHFPERTASFSSLGSSKVGTLSLDFTHVCYMADVNGGSIERELPGICSAGLSKDRHTAFLPPGSAVTIDSIPRGSGYVLKIYAFEGGAGACPSIASAFSASQIGRVYEVASKTFNMDADVVTVDITMADPGANVAVQRNMSACLASGTQPVGAPILISPNGSRLSLAVAPADGVRKLSSPGNYRLTLVKDGSR